MGLSLVLYIVGVVLLVLAFCGLLGVFTGPWLVLGFLGLCALVAGLLVDRR